VAGPDRPAHRRSTDGRHRTRRIATPIPAARARDAAARADDDRKFGPSRIRVLLEALAYAGALIDPTGALAVQRSSRIQGEPQQRGHR